MRFSVSEHKSVILYTTYNLFMLNVNFDLKQSNIFASSEPPNKLINCVVCLRCSTRQITIGPTYSYTIKADKRKEILHTVHQLILAVKEKHMSTSLFCLFLLCALFTAWT